MTTQSNQGAGAGSGVTEMISAGERVRRWAGFYVSTLGWAVSPRWLAVGEGEICACPEGEACPYPGKHLVDGHRVVRPSQAVGEGGGAEADAAAVAAVWPQEHPDVARGAWGVAALCGSESGLLVWDLGRDGQMPADWLGGRGSLVARTPSGGRQWFFRLEPGEAVASVGGVPGVGGKILAEGSYVALHPYGGYTWSGMDALRGAGAEEGGLAEVPVGLRLVLEMAGVLVQGLEGVHEDDPWRCLPGAGLVGPVTRSYKRVGDVRRFVDGWGHLVRWTPGGGWSLWTSGKGWVSGEAAEAGIEAVLADGLVAAVRREAVDHRAGGRDAEAAEATRWAGGMGRRSVGYVKGELRSDPRVVLDGPEAWDADGGICGLPMVDGVGRVVDLGTGAVLPGARERLVSRKLGAGAGAGGAWERARAVRKYLDDLGEVMGEDWLRLLQRVSGMTMFGAGGVEAARRAAGVGALAGGTDVVVELNGPPRSGKSTFVETLAAVMGDYARPMNQNLLFGRSGNPEFVVAAVRGARMIHLGEPPVGAELNVPLLKAISGGDSLTGRGVYGRAEVSYRPDCTVWLSTNHHLEHADEALWQRMRIFEFRTDWSARGGKGQSWIREAMIGDPVEREAFLAWVLAGARALVGEEDGWGGSWQVWDDAADEARAGVDPVAQFMAEVLVVGAGAAGSELSAARLKSAWQAWSMGHEIALDRALTLQHVMQELHQRAGRAGADWVKSARAYRNMAIREP